MLQKKKTYVVFHLMLKLSTVKTSSNQSQLCQSEANALIFDSMGVKRMIERNSVKKKIDPEFRDFGSVPA